MGSDDQTARLEVSPDLEAKAGKAFRSAYSFIVLSTIMLVCLAIVIKYSVLNGLISVSISYIIVKFYICTSIFSNILVVGTNHNMLDIYWIIRRKRVGGIIFQIASISMAFGILFGGIWIPLSGAGFSRGVEIAISNFVHPEARDISLFNPKTENELEMESFKYLRWLILVQLACSWAPLVFAAAFRGTGGHVEEKT